ncbi:MAG TPA: hypothetical protein VK918_08330 [Pyrinomonadaceae bacterium]|nr:hypothetical protein [Pyrinomonadaceae bacterium]
MKRNLIKPLASASFVAAMIAGASLASSAQIRPRPTPTPVDAEVISRADDFPMDDGRIYLPANPQGTEQPAKTDPTAALEERIRSLESSKREDPEAKQRRLLLNLDILTRAEQRVEALRKQLFEMIEKENSIQMRLDSISLDARPEMIERSVATMGSLRPEELREARQRQLTAEQTNLRSLLNEVQRNKANIEGSILRAEDLVERIRVKLEREIDEALDDDHTDNSEIDQF